MKKRILSMLLAFAILPAAFSLTASAQQDAAKEPEVSAKAAILIDADSGAVLFAKNETEKLPMASTTKIMTALLTLEAAAVHDPVVTITDEMIRVEGSSMGIMPGNKIALSGLAEGMLMVSGNDAANAAAIAVAGSTQEFVKRMNSRAREMGLKNTSFVTPSGLDADGHYSTAKDMAVLGAQALKNEEFATIVSRKEINVQFVNPVQTIRYGNHNRLLSLYPDCIGIKTGFTKKAGRCLVSAAERDGVRLVAVTLRDPNDWDDHIKLFEYGFSERIPFEPDTGKVRLSVPVAGGVKDSVAVTAGRAEEVSIRAGDEEKIKCVTELPRFVYAPVREGELVGSLRYTLNGKTIAEAPLTAAEDVQSPPPRKSLFQRIRDRIGSLFR